MTVKGTMLSRIEGWAKSKPSGAALKDRRPDGSWDTTTWAEYLEKVRRVGKGLISLGVEPGDALAIVGNNRADWVICQHGINAAGAIPAPLYTTLLPDQMAYIVENAQSKVVICDTQEQLDKYLSICKTDGCTIEHIISMDELTTKEPKVISLAELMKRGDKVDDAKLDARLDAVKPDDVALLIYTSGTTGLPKGAMMTHAGIDTISLAVADVFPTLVGADARYVSYLPLCHAAEQGMTNFAGLITCSEVYFCPDMTKIKEYLLEARPTYFLAVPRVWEKFEAALRAKMAEATGLKAKLTKWAMKTELAAFEEECKTGRPVSSMSRSLANKLVMSKIKTALGLDALQVAVSGAAPISRSTLEFFASIGIPIHEGYGMTETTAFASVQPFGKPKFGTIGKPLLGVQAKIAGDGEILLKGTNMVKGYFRLPEKTDELYDEEGWMHTGDLGNIDEDGYISITGRKKDLIITAGGKNVAPSEMEGYLQAIPGVAQAVVVGDRQPYLCALIVLDPDALSILSAESGATGLTDVATAAKNPAVKKYIEAQTETLCNAKVARYQTIKKIEILPEVFSVEGEELTPTLKVKRNVVNEKYASVIDSMYKSGKDAEARA